ncbi:carbon-monoxide dehydrogenase iron sulfur subunit [Carboxydocella sporoproducens DSM 16521]|uniref:Carbon-monoxide dehydrogenase iron sulfur subunit n=2 Tax=Carboxydocella TaxID=178898 RepID=A0A1T4RJB1_9FIRM|nr:MULTISPECIES: 4Fe-4S dicluster domain-containing protein [Carboxydocella]AVX20793.1 4Fe-4S dicluster domain-containing electron transfer protein CooF [Carboxydocella thermautotrophica]AVX31212.1 4Fe-4S dicluster domain-containing electron transfer protein CooF [Carboxydocella thermautotrophica]SKA15866.1 carbon-monoxide dehydrogenase iron sulfur subunit [Carboxydocella sporoproducens DSM 16521]
MKKVMVRAEKCLSCHSCELACAVAHSQQKNLFLTILNGEKPVNRVQVEKTSQGAMPLQCRHCDDAPCLLACMTGAIYRAGDGSVQLKRERCVSCWMCIMSCPYGVMLTEAEGKAVKCDLCHDTGKPACVQACPTQALVYEEGEEFAAAIRKNYAKNLI